jgi:outer membrane protein OmpA-like peptidoglycan-associated protein/tetratricopeptide (TPR) repeat protein
MFILRYTFIILALMISSSAFSQQKLKIRLAEKHFQQYSYMDAIPFFEDLVKNQPEDKHLRSRLAECYRLTGNTSKAEENYSFLAKAEDPEPAHLLVYAHLLEANKKYADAKPYFEKYALLNAVDSRGRTKSETDKISFYKDSALYEIKNLPFNTERTEFGLFPLDEKTFIYTSNRKGEPHVNHQYNWNNLPFLDLYIISKNDEGKFTEPVKITKKVNSKFHEGPAFYDEQTGVVFLTRNNFFDGKTEKSKDGVNKLKLFTASISNSDWKNLSAFPYNDNEYSVGHAALSKDGSKLYFASDMPGGLGGTDIYVCFKEGDSWGKPKNLGAPINTEGDEMFPFVYANSDLYFSSNGHPGLGGLDIFIAKNENGNFSSPINLGYPINSNKDDFSFYLNKEGISGYFSSNRAGGNGDDDIFSFLKMKKQFFVSGKISDKETAEILALAYVYLTDEEGNVLAHVQTGNDGSFKFEVEPGKKYLIKGNKTKYIEGVLPFSIDENVENISIKTDLMLEKEAGIVLVGLVMDKATKSLLEGVKIVITDDVTKEEIINITTSENGSFRKVLTDKKINDSLNYTIKIERAGYLGKTVNYNAYIKKSGDIKLNEFLDIALDKIEVGTDIGKLINIKPIYFDLGKFNIRKDAAIELDKVVKVMIENPSMEIELGSHTDCRGTEASNMALSDKRAKSSAEYIKKRITNPERITGKGYGESKLVNYCECEVSKITPCTEEEHQVNRRTEFTVIKF